MQLFSAALARNISQVPTEDIFQQIALLSWVSPQEEFYVSVTYKDKEIPKWKGKGGRIMSFTRQKLKYS